MLGSVVRMRRELIFKIMIPIVIAILVISSSHILLYKDEQIQKERKEKYSGGGNILTGFFIMFFLINLPGILLTFEINITNNQIIILNTFIYLVLSSLIIFLIQKTKRK